MFRYVAMLWDATDLASTASAERLGRRLSTTPSSWRVALNRPGMRILFVGARQGANRVYSLHDDQGIVLGKLFNRKDADEIPSPVTEFDAASSRQIVDSGGRTLVDRYWGRYVAFIRNGRNNGSCVLRGPMGTLPCFFATHERITIFFSWIEDVLSMGLPLMSLNWDYIEAHLPAVALECRETALNEVSQVLAGECVDVSAGTVTSTLHWRLDEIAAHTIEDRNAAATSLRRVARHCISAWASSYGGLLVRLSGGLDSSIIVNSLRETTTPSPIACLTYFSPGADSDEREYARIAAIAAGRALIERQRDPHVRLEQILDIARSPKPSVYLGNIDTGRSDAEVAHSIGADAVFTGAGGDTLFYQLPTDLPAADYARSHGVGPRLFDVALDAARLAGVSIWSALDTSIRQGILRRPLKRSPGAQQFPLVTSHVVATARNNARFRHPAIANAGRQAPGKRWQIRSMILPVEYYNPLGLDDDPELVHPLLSQPLVELCMRIPSYILIKGGRDRALARQAFASDLPPLIARRRSKGGMEEHIKLILLRNKAFVRGLLLEGVLVSRNLLNREKLEEALSDRPTAMENPMVDLYTYLSIEAWLHSWSHKRRRAAA